jgi:hypothetical protein
VGQFVVGAIVGVASALAGVLCESLLQRRRERRRVRAAAKLVLMELQDLRTYVEGVLRVDTASIEAIDAVRPDSVERSIWEAHRHSIVEAADEEAVQAVVAVYGRCFDTIKSAGTYGAHVKERSSGVSERELLADCIEKIKVAEARLRPLLGRR